jgi:hypothetical protein
METDQGSQSRQNPSWMLLGLVLLTMSFLTAACTAQSDNQPIQTTQTLPILVATDTPEADATLPTATELPAVTMTPGGLENLPPPAGIVFLTDEGHFITQSDGPPRLIYQPEESGVWSNLSADGRFILVINPYDQVLVDLQMGSQTQIWPRDGLNLCPFHWVGGQTGLLITVLLPPGADPVYSCNLGSPVLLSAASLELTILDERGSGLSAPVVSPDGKGFAYNLDGAPWIYSFDTGPAQLDLGQFGMDSLRSAQLADPAWSKSGRFLAWTFRVRNESSLQGVIVLDLDRQEALILTPYEVSAYENSRPRLYFSPSEKYLILDHYLASQSDFASQVLSVYGQVSRQLDGYFNRWSPEKDWLILEKKPGEDACRLAVESADGSLSIPICRGDQAIWSPDGSQIITHPYNRELFWLTQLESQSSVQIDLPAGAEILGWEAGE